jgi:hypothetical protein
MIPTLQANESNPSKKSGYSSNKTLLLMANGVYDVNDTSFTPPDYQFFVSEIMKWSSQEANDFEQQAQTFFKEKFGVDVTDPKYAGRVVMFPFMLDPRWEYRVYQSSGDRVPGNGWVVRDGGFQLVALDPNGIELGGEFAGLHVAQGSVAAFGIYNVKVSQNESFVLHYQSRQPVLQNNGFPLRMDDKGVLIAPFDIYHEKFGHGWGFAHIWNAIQNDGKNQTNIRNVITFPAGAAFPDELKNYDEYQ